MIFVLMRVQHVLQRLVGDGPHLRQDVVRIPLVHVVHEQDAFACDVDGDVAALTGDHEQVLLELLHARGSRRWPALCVGRPGAEERKHAAERGGEADSIHAPEYKSEHTTGPGK